MKGFAILVIQHEGEEDYVCDGLGTRPTWFMNQKAAKNQVNFMKIGMEGDVQSINVVPYPKPRGGS